MREERGFLKRADGSFLYCTVHAPAAGSGAGDDAVVCCAPFFEEQVFCLRPLVDIARGLAERASAAVVRFDFLGQGESDGRFDASTLDACNEDLTTVLAHVRQDLRPRRVFLAGVRLGFACILDHLRAGAAADGLIAIDPVVDTAGYANDILRADLSRQLVVHRRVLRDREQLAGDLLQGGTVNIDGYPFGGPLFADLVDETRAAARQQPLSVPCLLLKTRRGTLPRDLELLQALAPGLPEHEFPVEAFWKTRRFSRDDYADLVATAAGWLAEIG